MAFRLLLLGLLALAPPPQQKGRSVDWPSVGGNPGCMRYSPLTQIDRGSVARLKVAWIYHTGDADPRGGTTIECTPIVIDGVMYVTTVRSKVVALDAATGRELWKYDPYDGFKPKIIASGGVNRGVAYWSGPRTSPPNPLKGGLSTAEADRRNSPLRGLGGDLKRILLGAADGRLISLDAATGRPDPAFGKEGVVDFREGLEYDTSRFPYGPTSAPVIYRDLAIVGFSASEGPGPGAPGDIRAFNVRTGKEVWRFHTVARPGEFGAETWDPDAWKQRSGTIAWGGLSVDEKRGMVFAGLGSASFDFYGGDRKGNNLFANCTIALDAKTGRRIWHFQTLHHDLWDHDLPIYPNLVTVTRNGRKLDAAAQVTKTGFVFLFDRETGKPLFDVVERPVPASDIPGEQASPTQPFPVKPPPFSRQYLTPDDITDISPEAHSYVAELAPKLRFGPIHTPPSVEGTVTIPGFHGGATWSGASFDPATGLLYVNSNNQPNVTQITRNPPGSSYPYGFGGYNRFLDQNGYPAIKPPWGLLTAIDLNRGEFAWQVTLGEYPELTARGIPPTGTENFGGSIVTAGGLVFIGGTKDEKLHAFDKSTGKLLWDYKLDAGGYATPCTYMVDGRQYLCIAAGGGGKLGTRSGDEYVAFALPEDGAARPLTAELFAGGGQGSDGSAAREAKLIAPFSMGEDRFGNLFFTEFTGGDRVRKIDRAGRVTTVAGTGVHGYGGDGGPAIKAQFDGLHTLLVDDAGDIFVTDTWNHRIRRIDPANGSVTTFAGTGEKGFSGDGGPASRAQLNEPYCIAFGPGQKVMYVADLANRRIRAIDMSSGMISTVAGTGRRGEPADGAEAKSSPLVDPRAVTVDSRGNLYILERSGNCLRVVDPSGQIRTVAGTGKAGYSGDGGPAQQAAMKGPKHIWIDRDESVLIADTDNHVIRRYLPSDGRIVRVAGTGSPSAEGAGGPADRVGLNQPHGVFVDRAGVIYIADSLNNRILRLR